MKQEIVLVKRCARWLGAVGFLAMSVPASAAVLTLMDWTTLPVPPGADHADLYELPLEIALSGAMPITQVEIDYQNHPFVTGAGIHEIKSAAFLFASGDLASTTVLENTTERFLARIVFTISPINRWLTGLTDRFAPAFAAFHGPALGSATTSAKWTVTFQNGTTQTAYNGIIPEPRTLVWLAVSATLAMFIRRTNRANSAV
jgi:hypothetical protein